MNNNGAAIPPIEPSASMGFLAESFMKKSIEFSLVPDENKLYNAKMFKDNSLFKEEKVDAETMKYYMLQKMSEKELTNLRTAVKLFKTKKIKLHLKEQN